MFSLFRYIFRLAISYPRRSILLVGLDQAGKSCWTNEVRFVFKKPPILPIVPTNGQSVVAFDMDKISWQLWDLGGQTGFRNAWKLYYKNTDVVFFCIDCSDVDRLDEALGLLRELLAAGDLRYAPVCVLAHKQDVSGAISADQLKLRIMSDQACTAMLSERVLDVFPTEANAVAPHGEKKTGVATCLQWISNATRRGRWAQMRLKYRRQLAEAAQD
nr:ArlX1 [Gefionella okellyi]